MVNENPTNSDHAESVAPDPIVEAQNAVMEAKALLECIEKMLESPSSGYRSTDMIAACSGVIRILDEVGNDLDPGQFRKAVLASEAETEVAPWVTTTSSQLSQG